MSVNSIIGWDIGGAHVKLCHLPGGDSNAEVRQYPCALWQGMDKLDTVIEQSLQEFDARGCLHAITMTGELTDLFTSRREGVAAILAAMMRHIPEKQIQVFAGRSGFVESASAVQHCDQVASANWLATAMLLADEISEGLLIDIGSTTTDIIPFLASTVLVDSVTDRQRLIHHELVYTGITRTPLMALAEKAPMSDGAVPLMAEYFATTADIYRILGLLPDHADQHATADGREKTVEQSSHRLARMVAADKDEYSDEEWRLLAEFFSQQQQEKIIAACERVLSRCQLPENAPVVAAGIGGFLIAEIARSLGRPCVDFDTCLQADFSQQEFDSTDCAPAVAIALLGRKRLGPVHTN